MNDKKRPAIPEWLRHPIVEFFETEASAGIVLIFATVAALVWANSGWRASYFDLWHTCAGFSCGDARFKLSLHHWMNDGLMALFFFYVGLEIKREVLSGELASAKKAALPAMAALGGMLVPAAFYVALSFRGAGAHGWGVPMATEAPRSCRFSSTGLGRGSPIASCRYSRWPTPGSRSTRARSDASSRSRCRWG